MDDFSLTSLISEVKSKQKQHLRKEDVRKSQVTQLALDFTQVIYFNMATVVPGSFFRSLIERKRTPKARA